MTDDPSPDPGPRGPDSPAPGDLGYGGRRVTFGDVLYAATPRAFAALLLIAANVVVWGLMVRRGVDPSEPSGEALHDWGANFGPDVRAGEWWRLFTSMFLHAGWIHLAMNMYGLYAIGPFVERLFGNAAFLVLYALSGLAGSLASVAITGGLSVGASGAIFGVLGGLVGYLVRQGRTSIPRPVVKSLTTNLVVIIALNVVLGLTVPQIDQAAHGGGFLSGAVLGVALAQPLSSAGVRRRGKRAALVLLLGLAALAAACAWLAR